MRLLGHRQPAEGIGAAVNGIEKRRDWNAGLEGPSAIGCARDIAVTSHANVAGLRPGRESHGIFAGDADSGRLSDTPDCRRFRAGKQAGEKRSEEGRLQGGCAPSSAVCTQ